MSSQKPGASIALSFLVSDFLRDQSYKFDDLLQCFGSPLHIVLPDQAAENARLWVEVLRDTHTNTHIQFAMKACKSMSLARAIAGQEVGVDVASEEEFVSAIQSGFQCGNISVTGPDKPDAFLELAAVHGATIHVDSLTEAERVASIGSLISQGVQVCLRMLSEKDPKSRFGMSADDALRAIPCFERAGVSNLGISFHLNGYDLENRIDAVDQAAVLAHRASEIGCNVDYIDVGGGFPVKYITHFERAAYKAGGHLSGTPEIDFYPYDAPQSSYEFARLLLNGALALPSVRKLTRLGQFGFRFQPGRSMVEQCGLTMMRITAVKHRDAASSFVVLNGMSFSVSERWFGSDFAPEPLLFNCAKRTENADSHSYFLVGQSCLENDTIRNRAVRWSNIPQAGDVVVFVNTAGYQMDSNETPFHQIPLPEKISARLINEAWKFFKDEKCNIRLSA